MTMIKLNLKGNSFKTVEEGNRNLEITKVEVVPSGKPTEMKLYMRDVEDTNATLINSYKFTNETSLWVMGLMLNVALGLEDGEEFDTADAQKLVGVVLNCDVAHSEYNGKTYANIKKVNSRVDGYVEEPTTTVENIPVGRSVLNDLD